ncbi:MAG: DegQ family serine endoprotease [Pseudomonadota bacterium]
MCVKPLVWTATTLALAAVLLIVQASQALAQDRPESFADLAEALLPSVVNISTTQVLDGDELGNQNVPQFPPGSPFEDFFEDFQNRRGGEGLPPRQASALGSGFIIDSSGIVITNNHVIAGADEITVILQNDESYVAELVGADAETDIAVLRVEADEPLPAVPWGDSDALRVGDWVMAIGNPFGLGGSVSAGIVSARGRDINSGRYDNFIQTDAAINRGNSGGPLFDLDGQVVGINSAIYSPTGSSVGIGFAIPANLAQGVISQILEFGRTRRGWLGVRIQTVTDDIAESLGLEEARGALVASVTPGGPAEEAGIIPGDVIIEFNDRDVEDMRGLPRIVAETTVGAEVDVDVFRSGEIVQVEVVLGELEVAEEQGLLAALPPDEAIGIEEELSDLGLTVSSINDQLRSEYNLSSDAEGVVILSVDPESQAASEGLVPGEVIVEVGQEAVTSPEEISERIEAAQDAGRRSVLLLIDREGQLRFVALNVSEG